MSDYEPLYPGCLANASADELRRRFIAHLEELHAVHAALSLFMHGSHTLLRALGPLPPTEWKPPDE